MFDTHINASIKPLKSRGTAKSRFRSLRRLERKCPYETAWTDRNGQMELSPVSSPAMDYWRPAHSEHRPSRRKLRINSNGKTPHTTEG